MPVSTSVLPVLADVVSGQAVFADDMPIWLSHFGDDVWPFTAPQSPLFVGQATSSIVWSDYIMGRGMTLNHPNSSSKSKYDLCLTYEIVSDLKVAAVIHGHFPKLLKDSRSAKAGIDPKTVKGRIDELARFLSLVIIEGKKRLGYSISRLDQIPFELIKEVVPTYPGRGAHLKRALKLISEPFVQKNLSAPLQWNLLDITKSSIAWPETEAKGVIPTLSDTQFLFLLAHCKRAIARFKHVTNIEIHDSECRTLPLLGNQIYIESFQFALNAYYCARPQTGRIMHFKSKYGIHAREVVDLIREAHSSAIMLVLLFTAMRSSETKFLMCDSLRDKNGYWFIDSKVVKGKSKDIPVSEGWLAIDITRDAYDVLFWVCQQTGNPYLFSSPVVGFAKSNAGYRGSALNTKLSRWIKRIDKQGLFASWTFSVHQCRETLVYQLAKQQVGMPFLSMQLKHFHSQFNNMPNAVTAGYGQYRSQLLASVAKRIADARESALMDVYGENAKFAGGGASAHKARIDTFFSGLGLFGKARERYIKSMAQRGVKLMPTSIGSCTKNFIVSSGEQTPPCYGDYQCDVDCGSHVITERSARALAARKVHALAEAEKESNAGYRVIWLGLAQKLEGHIQKFQTEQSDV